MVIICGPALHGSEDGFGGGVGGIVVAMRRLCHLLSVNDVDYVYCELTRRSFNKLWFILLPARLLRDSFSLIRAIISTALSRRTRRGPVLVHIVADGGFALMRTLVLTCIANIFRLGIVLDVRGNAIGRYSGLSVESPFLILWKLSFIQARAILLQNSSHVTLLRSLYASNKFIYCPNCLSDGIADLLSTSINSSNDPLTVLFVGYCFDEKGVFDAVQGCIYAALSGLDIELRLAGKEHPDFSIYLDTLKLPPNLTINRLGIKNMPELASIYKTSNIFLFPTKFPSEGHPNVINEAIASRLPIITTKTGAIPCILDDSMCFYVDPGRPDQISEALRAISNDTDEANARSSKAFFHLKSNFSQKNLANIILKAYDTML
jgi:glycosyltransferase involved in cell wall biosynthesis